MSGPRRLGSLLSKWNPGGVRATAAWGADQSAAALTAAWENAVGPSIARRSRPTRFKAGVLTVLTASSTWSNELTYLAPTIIEGLRKAVPEANLQRLRFMVATGRTKLLLEGERLASSSKRVHRDQSVHSLASVSTPREEEDAKMLVARLAHEQRSLNQWRDQTGWATCTACGRRFWAASPASGICAPCLSSRRRGAEARIEVALMQAPWLTAAGVRAALPKVSDAAYRSTRQRLLTRWQSEMVAAERRLRRSALTPADRVTAWSYLMLLTGMPEHDIGRAVVCDVLGPVWTNALFAPVAAAPQEARPRSREKYL